LPPILTLKRKVRSTTVRRHHEVVQEEVRKGLEKFSEAIIGKFEDTVSGWHDKPVFKTKVTVTKKRWNIKVKVVRTTKIGKIFGWVDKGTGSRGGDSDYDILPKKKKFLSFNVPHSPVTMPNPSISGFPPTGSLTTVRTKAVKHPGIYPRNFTQSVAKWAKSKEAGAFRSNIEASAKRAFRKIKKNGV